MHRSLSSLVPNAVDLLALEVEELAGVLLIHLKSYEGVSGNPVYQNGLISEKNFLDAQEQRGHGQQPEYGNRQPQVNAALMEARSWLEREGFLIRDPRQPTPWFLISRRGLVLFHSANPPFIFRLLNNLLRYLAGHRIVV